LHSQNEPQSNYLQLLPEGIVCTRFAAAQPQNDFVPERHDGKEQQTAN
jgi:hypothetical protein